MAGSLCTAAKPVCLPFGTKRTRWHYVYFLLAAFDVAAIVCSLIFSSRIINIVVYATSDNRHWVECTGRYTRLLRLAAECRQPAVDVMHSLDTLSAAQQLSAKTARFRAEFDAVRVQLQTSLAPSFLTEAQLHLTRINDNLLKLELDSERMIQRVAAGHGEQAHDLLQSVDDACSNTASSVGDLIQLNTRVQNAFFDQQLAQTGRLTGYLWWFGLGGVLMVACVSLYGHKLSDTIQHSIETTTQQAQALAEKEARLRTIFDTAADGIVTMNDQGIIDTCNQATLHLLGTPRSDVIGKPIAAFMDEADDAAEPSRPRPLRLLNINALIGTKRELAGYRADGSRFYAELAVAEVRFNERRVITGILRDVTERRQFEAELKQARTAAEAATEVKSQFLANMSHEIRTPMSAIIGYADLLLEPGQSTEERTRCVETIRRNADHLLTLINDILDLSKIEAGKMTVELLKCSPYQILNDVASFMRVRALEKRIGFDVTYESRIPEVISCDPLRVRQILINLIGNAIKFTKAGSVRVQAWAEQLSGPHPMMCFRVVDTGIGMSQQQIERLFRPFTQADYSTTRQFGGTGLGLTICKRLVEMMAGSISVSSVPGLGSSFEFKIAAGPLDGVRIIESLSESDIGAMSAAQTVSANHLRLTSRILLAEDGVDNYRLISYHLRKAGATVVHAENGQVAVEKALEALSQRQPFDLIFMDMQMPVMDGYRAASVLRQTGYRGPIVALTAHAMTGDRERCLTAGCDDYLSKPVEPQNLIAVARRYSSAPSAEISSQTSARNLAAAYEEQSCDAGSGEVTVRLGGPVCHRPVDLTPDEEPLVSEFADDHDMVEITSLFLEGLESRIALLDAAFEADDWKTLSEVAHQLKGAGGSYGYPIISEVASELERFVKAGATKDQVRSVLDRLVLMSRRAVAGHRRGATADAVDQNTDSDTNGGDCVGPHSIEPSLQPLDFVADGIEDSLEPLHTNS